MSSPSQFDPSQRGPGQEFQTFLANGEFNIQHCADCQRHVFYPRLICPHCGANSLSWVTASGNGEVYSTSVPRGGKEGDYNIALIDLAEGPRLLSRVEGIAPDAVKIGMPVVAFIGEVNGNAAVLFKPASNGQDT